METRAWKGKGKGTSERRVSGLSGSQGAGQPGQVSGQWERRHWVALKVGQLLPQAVPPKSLARCEFTDCASSTPSLAPAPLLYINTAAQHVRALLPHPFPPGSLCSSTSIKNTPAQPPPVDKHQSGFRSYCRPSTFFTTAINKRIFPRLINNTSTSRCLPRRPKVLPPRPRLPPPTLPTRFVASASGDLRFYQRLTEYRT